jgi:hypothetical protein
MFVLPRGDYVETGPLSGFSRRHSPRASADNWERPAPLCKGDEPDILASGMFGDLLPGLWDLFGFAKDMILRRA